MKNRNPRTSPDGLKLQSYLGNLMCSDSQAGPGLMDSGRRAIWYELTALEQEIAHWSSQQPPREAKVLADLLKDVWAIWDNEWQTGRTTPLLIVNFLDRIAGRISTTSVLQHVQNLRGLVENDSRQLPPAG